MLLILVYTLTILLFILLKWNFSHWKQLNVPSLSENPIFGNLTRMILNKEAAHTTITKFYNTMKSKNHQHAGFYASLIPFYIPISNTLIDGEHWRDIRARLTPAYTLAKIKSTVETQLICAMSLEKEILTVSEKKIPINVNEMCSRYSMDLIASCAFGLNIKTLDDPKQKFRKYALLALKDYRASFKFGFCYFFKNYAKKLGLRFINKSVSEYFRDLSEASVKMREETKFRRNDLLQLLIDLKNAGGISSDELYAQCYAFFVAGFNTTSLTIAYCLYEIAKNCQVQEDVKKEIVKVLDRYGGEVGYDALLEMEYLQQVIDETMRIYPPVPVYLRECTEDFPIPNTDTVLPRGTRVIIPVYGIQHDEEYFPQPEIFNPDRFSKENLKNISPHTYMPFGEGPRLCIASKFAIVQIKLGIIAFLKNNWIRLNKKTPEKISLAKDTLFLYADDDIVIDCI